VRSTRHKSRNNLGPVLVHCSAGVGRTGTMIAIHNLVSSINYQFESIITQTDIKDIAAGFKTRNELFTKGRKNMLISVFGCVRKLREQRPMMV